jgi:GT2 family glycosyltransferase
MSKKIAVLMTVHNRKGKTLGCLSALQANILSENYELSVFLVNDGCTDGTDKAVVEQFPKVKVIQGDGNLFWNRGMRLAWETAAKVADFDYYIWLNDDVVLYENAIKELLNCIEQHHDTAIICGTTCATTNNDIITYGGRIRRVGIVKPNGKMQSCDCCNGQICLIPRSVYKIMGMTDSVFHHGFGDWDYGFRAKKKGIDIFAAPSVSGLCDVNDDDAFPPYQNPANPLLKRLKILYSPIGKNPYQSFIYTYRHVSLLSAFITIFILHINVFFPKHKL